MSDLAYAASWRRDGKYKPIRSMALGTVSLLRAQATAASDPLAWMFTVAALCFTSGNPNCSISAGPLATDPSDRSRSRIFERANPQRLRHHSQVLLAGR